jgi:ribulose kinase
MKNLLVLIGLALGGVVFGRNAVIDTLYIPTGTDTVYTLSTAEYNFTSGGYLEVLYDSLDDDDATFDLGPSAWESTDSIYSIAVNTFNSWGDVLGVSLPFTMDVTTNADSYYSTASVFFEIPDFMGEALKIKITAGSCTAGSKIYIKYRKK